MIAFIILSILLEFVKGVADIVSQCKCKKSQKVKSKPESKRVRKMSNIRDTSATDLNVTRISLPNQKLDISDISQANKSAIIDGRRLSETSISCKTLARNFQESRVKIKVNRRKMKHRSTNKRRLGGSFASMKLIPSFRKKDGKKKAANTKKREKIFKIIRRRRRNTALMRKKN